jgi:orotidine-5'-phosphate decarboxylase
MTRQELIHQINHKKSFLCVGLDIDPDKMPKHLPRTMDGMLAFNKAIIEATSDLCVAYKPNLAFYERFGSEGWQLLEDTIKLIPKECMVIADAKRGDIGNTSKYYAEAIFNHLQADAITVAPYMGEDSVSPFLAFKNKWTIVLGLTSNKGASDFQFHGEPDLYKTVLQKCQQWGSPEQLMFVIGATRPEMFKQVRAIAPDHFLLVPGVGAQGGSLTDVAKYGMNKDVGLLVNSSRGIIYASKGTEYAAAARKAALTLQQEMAEILSA